FFLFRLRQVRISFFNFRERAGFELINQVVSLDAETLASAHLDVRPRAIFIAQLNAEFLTSRGRKRDHLVTEMNARVLADLGNNCRYATCDDLLRIRLSRVDDVVDGDAAAEL